MASSTAAECMKIIESSSVVDKDTKTTSVYQAYYRLIESATFNTHLNTQAIPSQQF